MGASLSGSKLKKLQKPLERYILPLILLLWPMVSAASGINLMDAGYALGNYRYLGRDGADMWFLATFLANELGKLFEALPGGGTMLGMNLYTSLLLSGSALVVYCVFRRIFPGWMIFIGEILAESLCWCPTVILYNWLSTFLLTLGCAFLFIGVSGIPQRKRWYILAGVCLGMNVTVKTSNLLDVILILALWFWCAVVKTGAAALVKRTLLCVLGYGIGFMTGYLLSAVQYGPGAYFSMIPELLGLTSSMQDYTLSGMLFDTARAYGSALRWFLILVLCVIVGMILFMLPQVKKKPVIGVLVYLFGCAVIVKFFYSEGVFTVNYQDYWCMFEWAMLFIILSIILAVLAMTGISGGGADERFLGCLSLLVILIAPFGSNNYTFPILDCLFVPAPVTIWMLRRYWQPTREKLPHWSWHLMALFILVCTLFQGALFHLNFAFGDGTDGTKRTAVTGIPYLAGMHTTPENAETLDGLYNYLAEGRTGDGEEILSQKLLSYGNAPGLSVFFGMEPALDSTWPDLASYSSERLSDGLSECIKSGELPVVIIHRENVPGQVSEEKETMIASFLEEGGYTRMYENGSYEVYLPSGM